MRLRRCLLLRSGEGQRADCLRSPAAPSSAPPLPQTPPQPISHLLLPSTTITTQKRHIGKASTIARNAVSGQKAGYVISSSLEVVRRTLLTPPRLPLPPVLLLPDELVSSEVLPSSTKRPLLFGAGDDDEVPILDPIVACPKARGLAIPTPPLSSSRAHCKLSVCASTLVHT